MNNKRLRNWAELPLELTSEILSRLSLIDILIDAPQVCKSWHKVCKDPSMWRMIDMVYDFDHLSDAEYSCFETICRCAVDRSQGGLVEISIWKFCSDELLDYIANRSKKLRSLRLLSWCPRLSYNGLVSALVKLPLLENLDISQVHLYGKLDLKAIGNCCPLLKTFKLNRKFGNWFLKFEDERWAIKANDDEALAIAETMLQLRHLELLGNSLTNTGLKAILDNCLHLEHLDLQGCFYIKPVGDLEKQCSQRIKSFCLTDGDSDLITIKKCPIWQI